MSPGFIKTEMTDKIPEEYKIKLISRIPAGDLGTGDDVSNCVVFLASDMANYINGETIHVNGGMYMAWQFYWIIYEEIIINTTKVINGRRYKIKDKKNSCRSFRYWRRESNWRS